MNYPNLQVQVQSKPPNPSRPSLHSPVHLISGSIPTSSPNPGSRPVNPSCGRTFAHYTTWIGWSNTRRVGLLSNAITLFQLWIPTSCLNWEYIRKGEISSCNLWLTHPSTRLPVFPLLVFQSTLGGHNKTQTTLQQHWMPKLTIPGDRLLDTLDPPSP